MYCMKQKYIHNLYQISSLLLKYDLDIYLIFTKLDS